MPQVIQTGFSAGELSADLYARVDLAKYFIGAALLRNFFVNYRGGASNRPGTIYSEQAKDSDNPVRMIPFQFSTEQTYALEFGNLYMRPHKGTFDPGSGQWKPGPVLEAAKNITSVSQSTSAVVTSASHGYVEGDWAFIEDVEGMTEVNNRTYIIGTTASNTFAIKDLFGSAIDSSAYGTYTTAGTVSRLYTLTTPYQGDDLALLKFTQNADIMTLTHPDYQQRDLTRSGDADWSLTTVAFASAIAAPTGLTASATGGTSYYLNYTVTALNETTGEESQASTPYSINVDGGALNVTLTWNAVTSATAYNIYRAPITNGTTPPPNTSLFGRISTVFGYDATTFKDGFTLSSNIIHNPTDFSLSPPQARSPLDAGPIASITVTNGGSGYTMGATATVSDPSGTGATLTVTTASGTVSSIAVTTPGDNYSNATVIITGVGSTGSSATATATTTASNFPSCSTYFQQRQVYAGSDSYPETFWTTKTGLRKNMDVSVPSRDDDAITATIASLQVNRIRHMVPIAQGLILLSSGGAWQVSSGNAGGAMTPSSTIVQPQAYNGANDVAPLIVNQNILYIQDKGTFVRDLSYDFYANIYTGRDVSMLASHLFIDREISEWAWGDEPFKLAWCVRDDGKMLSLAYVRDQEVSAWSRHDTKGLFKSVCAINEGNESAIYLVVERLVNGQRLKYVERMASRHFHDQTLAWFLDSALINEFTYPAGTLSFTEVNGSTDIFGQEIEAGDTAAFSVTTAAFSASSVGAELRVNEGRFIVATTSSTTALVATCKSPPHSFANALTGEWSLTEPITSISGLWHLEGQTVSILAGGNVPATQTVANGAITLPNAASTVIVGLPYTAQLQTLRLEIKTDQGTIQGKRKGITNMHVRVEDSRGIKVGPTFDRLTEIKERTNELPGEPTRLTTGDEKIVLQPLIRDTGQICIQQDYPLPTTILGVIPEVTVGDTS